MSCPDWQRIEYTESTVTKFDTSIDRLKEYIRSCYHRDDIMLAELDGQFIGVL